MNRFFKILCVVGIVVVSLKIVQELIDVLYENYGKKYITTEE